MSNDLYTKHAKTFSETRTAPWKGWLKILENYDLKERKGLRILDIGCGNGRFYKFAKENLDVAEYLGIDNSMPLLNIAKSTGGRYLKLDIDNNEWEINEDFDLIVAFGIQHHLSSFSNRKHLLREIAGNLSNAGLAVITFWQFLEYSRYLKKVQKLKTENDFLMDFAQKKNARFCHFTDLTEIEELENHSGLQLIDSFRSDGRDETENIYRVYKVDNISN